MKRIGHILRGWGKSLGLLSISSAEQKLSDLRLKQCRECNFSAERKVIDIVNGHVQKSKSLYCTQCGCPCVEKTLVVDEVCPINTW